jgi:hypothetical protein
MSGRVDRQLCSLCIIGELSPAVITQQRWLQRNSRIYAPSSMMSVEMVVVFSQRCGSARNIGTAVTCLALSYTDTIHGHSRFAGNPKRQIFWQPDWQFKKVHHIAFKFMYPMLLVLYAVWNCYIMF